MATLILENSVINGLLHNAALVQEFPFLQKAKGVIRQRSRGCGSCGGGNSGGVDYNAVKSAVATLPDSDKAKFKRLSGASEVRVVFRTGRGIKSVTF